jgi:tetrahydromethanopterin S-methyltransferase subunit A
LALPIATTPKVVAVQPTEPVVMDKAGYFVILPLAYQGLIHVEHYSYDNSLLREIEGVAARALYATIIQNGWVTELSHAAYLGKELAKAELSLAHNVKYVQDGA